MKFQFEGQRVRLVFEKSSFLMPAGFSPDTPLRDYVEYFQILAKILKAIEALGPLLEAVGTTAEIFFEILEKTIDTGPKQ